MTEIFFYHYSENTLKFDRERIYIQDNEWNKPNGLWLSHSKNGWKTFCEDNSFRINKLKNVSKITLNDTSNILLLDKIKSIDTFINKYYIGEYDSGLEDTVYFIDWCSVTKDYDGIQINNYNNKLVDSLHFFKTDKPYAMPTLWYETLSCDSTCIWNLNAIYSIETF